MNKLESFARIFLILFGVTILSNCSLNEGEPRVTVCKKVVTVLLDISNTDIDWKHEQIQTEELANITVSLNFDVHDNTNNDEHTDNLNAACVYAYSDVAEYDVVGNEYDGSPTEVYLNDKMVGHYTLTKTVNRVMMDAAKGLFE